MSRVVVDLTKGGLVGHLYRLSIPIMGTSFVQMAYNFTDMAWLGRVSSQAVAAVGVVSVFIWIIFSMSYFGKTACEVLISQSIGKGSEADARAYAGHALTLSLFSGLSIGGLFAWFAPNLVDLYLLDSATRGDALSYMYVVLLSIPIVFVTSTMFGIYNGIGNSRVPFRVLSMGLVCNMLFDPLLIHGFGWGVMGAAWATVLSQVVVFVYFLYRFSKIDRVFGGINWARKLEGGRVWQIAKVGLPAAGLNVLFAVVSIYMGRLASSVGGAIGVAILTTGGQLEALTWNTSQGVTTALSTIVGQNYAAGLLDRVRRAYRCAMMFTLLVGLLGSIIFVFAGERLFSWIVPDPSVYIPGGRYLFIMGLSQIFMMIEITTQGLFYGMGRSYLPALISIGGNYLRIPLALYLIGFGYGLEAIWWSISISMVIKGIASSMAYVCVAVPKGRNKTLEADTIGGKEGNRIENIHG